MIPIHGLYWPLFCVCFSISQRIYRLPVYKFGDVFKCKLTGNHWFSLNWILHVPRQHYGAVTACTKFSWEKFKMIQCKSKSNFVTSRIENLEVTQVTGELLVNTINVYYMSIFTTHNMLTSQCALHWVTIDIVYITTWKQWAVDTICEIIKFSKDTYFVGIITYNPWIWNMMLSLIDMHDHGKYVCTWKCNKMIYLMVVLALYHQYFSLCIPESEFLLR